MSLTSSEYTKFSKLLVDLVDFEDNMNSWEQNFLKDMISKDEAYGDESYLSPEQWEILFKLEEKYL